MELYLIAYLGKGIGGNKELRSISLTGKYMEDVRNLKGTAHVIEKQTGHTDVEILSITELHKIFENEKRTIEIDFYSGRRTTEEIH